MRDEREGMSEEEEGEGEDESQTEKRKQRFYVRGRISDCPPCALSYRH